MCSCATKHLFWLQRSSFVCPSRGKPAICCKWAQSMWSLQASASRKVKSWTETRSLSLFIQLLKVGLSLWPTFTLISFLKRLFWNSITYCRIEKINLNLWTVGYMFKLLYVASSLPTWLSWGSVLMFVWQWLSSETKSTWLGWEKKTCFRLFWQHDDYWRSSGVWLKTPVYIQWFHTYKCWNAALNSRPRSLIKY